MIDDSIQHRISRPVAVHAVRILVKNGLAALLVALIGGFVLTFSMLGGISMSPLPLFFDVDIPGTPAGWRSFHLGMLMNGIMALALSHAVILLNLGRRALQIVVGGTITALWGNGLFYLFTMFAPNRGLTLGANVFGGTNSVSIVAFTAALLAAFALIVAITVMLCARFRAPDSLGSSRT